MTVQGRLKGPGLACDMRSYLRCRLVMMLICIHLLALHANRTLRGHDNTSRLSSGATGTMELSFDAAKFTETSMLRVHELQEGYQSLVSKASFAKPCMLSVQIMMVARPGSPSSSKL